jgi:hypothetical protein
MVTDGVTRRSPLDDGYRRVLEAVHDPACNLRRGATQNVTASRSNRWRLGVMDQLTTPSRAIGWPTVADWLLG